MGKNFAGLMAGLIFGIGLTISQMTNPAKVLGFLNILGNWDPSLALVMGGAMAVATLGYFLVWKRKSPVFGDHFHVPTNNRIDSPLVIGAMMFGAGWGLVGLCPGPAIAGLAIGGWQIWVFLAAMLTGMAVHEGAKRANLLP
ncbi:MAG: membrane protein [Hyphobacterium sp.]|nr:MAG: membrane protein [Hyphobacterium sp.]